MSCAASSTDHRRRARSTRAAITAASTHTGTSSGSATGVTPPMSMPVSVVRLVRGRERRLLHAEPLAHHPVHVETSRREDDARDVATGIGLADDQDGVGRLVGRDAVLLTESSSVGEVGIARHHLELDALRLERGDDVCVGIAHCGQLPLGDGLVPSRTASQMAAHEGERSNRPRARDLCVDLRRRSRQASEGHVSPERADAPAASPAQPSPAARQRRALPAPRPADTARQSRGASPSARARPRSSMPRRPRVPPSCRRQRRRRGSAG